MLVIEEIEQDIANEFPHVLYELNLNEYSEVVHDLAHLYKVELSDQQFLGISDWLGMTAYTDEELLESWRNTH